MVNKVTINERGGVSIPESFRRAYGLNVNDELIVEATEAGILLRPAATSSIEIYTEARIAEFLRQDAAIGKVLAAR